MAVNVSVRTKFKYQGHEYEHLEDLPKQVRHACEQALHGGVSGSGVNRIAVSSPGGITVNGQTYSSPEQMPADVRRLYDDVIAAVRTEAPITAPAVTAGHPPTAAFTLPGSNPAVRRDSPDARLLLSIGVAVLLCVIGYLLQH